MLFIDGTWKPGQGAEFTSTNPAKGEVVWRGRDATAADIDEAVTAAQTALHGWRTLTVERRAEFLHSVSAQFTEHKESLARTISLETGKPLWDARTEVQAMIGKIAVSLAALQERRSPSEITLAEGRGLTRYKPHGVVAVFGPFNFPGHIANGHIVPALAAGNTVVFKPSELTPKTAEETVKLWEAAGLPRGVLNLAQGAKETGQSLASHRAVNGIFFTGSLATGIALRKALVEHPEKILALELGGNNPLIVHQPRDARAAVYGTIQSAYITAGQRCTCARRLIVTSGNEEFLQLLPSAVQKIQVGLPDADPQPFFGPVIHQAAAQRVLVEQQRLVAGGARVLIEARRLDLGPAFVSPGLIDVTNCASRDDHEVFGPLLQVIRVDTLDDAIREANNTRYGLVAALFSESRQDFETYYHHVNAGLINWNRPTTGASGQLPFGGVGGSGNHRPAGYFMIDSCNVPVASLTSASLTLPKELSPGVSLP